MTWDGVTYCVNKDDKPAIVEVPLAMAGDSMITEWLCVECFVDALLTW